MITENQREIINKLLDAASKFSHISTIDIDLETQARAYEARKKAVKAVEAEFQALIDQIEENRRLIIKNGDLYLEIRELRAEVARLKLLLEVSSANVPEEDRDNA